MQAATVTIHVPSMLRNYSAGAKELVVKATTVRDALQQLELSRPALYQCVCNETGAVRRHVNLFVNTSLVRHPDELERALSPGDSVTIMPAVSGG